MWILAVQFFVAQIAVQSAWVTPFSLMHNFISDFSGVIGLLATGLFVSGHYVGIGVGGVERVAAYPLSLWLIVDGTSFAIGLQRRRSRLAQEHTGG